MLYRTVVWVRFLLQRVVLQLSRLIHRQRPNDQRFWYIGPYEIAGMVHQMGAAVPRSRSIVLARHPFFNEGYWWAPKATTSRIRVGMRGWLLGPWMLGRISREARGIVYVGAEGFINSSHDQRRFEFGFLRSRGVAVACFFTGNDIRSPALMRELEAETGRPNLGTYLSNINPVFATVGYDNLKRSIAEVANDHASLVFNAELDQRSYLRPGASPFRYFHPDHVDTNILRKFDTSGPRVVLHAPSSPILKGTPLVRAAVQQLRDEGYDFEYVELSGVGHGEVIRQLERSHIVLNEFYAYVPGVFAVEAMAAGCAVLTSADEYLDPQLPIGSNLAWLPTEHHRVAESLRLLLDDPMLARQFAVHGQAWVRDNAIASVSGAVIADALAAAEENR